MDPRPQDNCPTTGKPLASPTPPRLCEGEHPRTPLPPLRPSLTSTRVPLVTSSVVTVSSEQFMSACSRYSSGCRHIHLLKLRAKPRGYCRRGAGGGCTISLGSNPPAPDPTEKTCLENSKGETPALPLHNGAKRKRARKVFSGCSGGFYLLVKVVVESNQVEIAFEALQSPLEEILFGAAPLEAKETEPVMLSADQSCIPQQTRRLGKSPTGALDELFYFFNETFPVSHTK